MEKGGLQNGEITGPKLAFNMAKTSSNCVKTTPNLVVPPPPPFTMAKTLFVGGNILRSTEEAVLSGYYGPGLQLPTEREA